MRLICETARLRIRHLDVADAPFMLNLLNDPSFHTHIGDKGVRTHADAEDHIRDVHMASYETLGFGSFLVVLKEGDAPIGTCGLFKRDVLDGPDLGYAFLPAYHGKGYAFEAAQAVMAWGHENCGLKSLLAVTKPTNEASITLLLKLYFREVGRVALSPGPADDRLFQYDFTI